MRRALHFVSAFVVVLCGARPAVAQQNVVWTTTTSAVATGNSIQKTGGCDGCQDSGGVSTQQIANGTGYVVMSPAGGTALYVGLTRSTTLPLTNTQMDYAFAVYTTNACEIRELGQWKADCTFAPGDVLKVSIESGVVKYYRNGGPAAIYTSQTLPTGYPYWLGADLLSAGAAVNNAQISSGSGGLTPWLTTDVGAVGVAGTAVQSGGTFTVQGSGDDIWGTADAFRYVYQTLNGNGQLIARVTGVQNTNSFAKAGLMIRDGLAAGAAHVVIDIRPTGNVEFSQRGVAGNTTMFIAGSSVTIPYWTKLERIGSSVIASVSSDGTVWTQVGTAAISMGSTVNIGMIVCSHANTVLNTSTFDNVQLSASGGTSVPTGYTAVIDRTLTIPKPTPIDLTTRPAGSSWREPSFGVNGNPGPWIVRVTDRNTRPGAVGKSYTVTSAAFQAAWNATSTRFYIRARDSVLIPYNFDGSTMTATRIQPASTGDGGLIIQSTVSEPQFSLVSPDILYGIRQDPVHDTPIVKKYDFSTGTNTDILDLGAVTTIANATYANAISSSSAIDGPEKVCVLFGGSGQDAHYKVAVFQASPAGSNLVILDSLADTITANGTTTATPTMRVPLHHALIDQSGKYVILSPKDSVPVQLWVWELATNNITVVGSPNNGHYTTSFGLLINQAGSVQLQWQLRSLSNPGSSTSLISPTVTPAEQYIADHTSWLNAQHDVAVPVLSSTYRYDYTHSTTSWGPWQDEILAIDTSSPGTANTPVWRFAHHQSNVAKETNPSEPYFWYEPNAVISPNGRWAIFTSNWGKWETASDPESGNGIYRTDVFLLQLPTPQ